jgi:uncharacterized protein with ParB-like and HNH nuclease domain
VKRLKYDLMLKIIKEAKKKTLTMKYKATFLAILNTLKLAYLKTLQLAYFKCYQKSIKALIRLAL